MGVIGDYNDRAAAEGRLNAALDKAKAAASQETAWLIEFDASVSRTPAYYGKTEEGLGMTTDHAAAIRFARAQDAQAIIDDIGWNAAKPVEHMWCDPPFDENDAFRYMTNAE